MPGVRSFFDSKIEESTINRDVENQYFFEISQGNVEEVKKKIKLLIGYLKSYYRFDNDGRIPNYMYSSYLTLLIRAGNKGRLPFKQLENRKFSIMDLIVGLKTDEEKLSLIETFTISIVEEVNKILKKYHQTSLCR